MGVHETMSTKGNVLSVFNVFVCMWEIVSHQSCLQAFTFNSMWSEGRHFRARKIDERRTTHDCGVMGNFDTTTEEVRECGTKKRIIKVDF